MNRRKFLSVIGSAVGALVGAAVVTLPECVPDVPTPDGGEELIAHRLGDPPACLDLPANWRNYTSTYKNVDKADLQLWVPAGIQRESFHLELLAAYTL